MASKKSQAKGRSKKRIFSKSEIEKLLFPLKRLIIRGFSAKTGEAYDTLVAVAIKLRWWLVMIGQEVESEKLDSVPEKRQALLAYKLLGLIWFDQLPLTDNESFSLSVATRFPGFIRPEDILEAFSKTDRKLELECREIIFQEFLSEKKSLEVSINSFPKPYIDLAS